MILSTGGSKSKKKKSTKLSMFKNHKATDKGKKKGQVTKPVKDWLMAPSSEMFGKKKKSKNSTKSKKTKKNKSMMDTHEDQTNNKAALDAFNKAHPPVKTKKAKTGGKGKSSTSSNHKKDSYVEASKSTPSKNKSVVTTTPKTKTTTTKSNKSKTKTKTKVVAKTPKVTINSKDKAWYDAYNKSIYSGTANLKDWKHYNDLTKKYGLTTGQTSEQALHSLSIKALSGDKAAQQYLKTLHLKGQKGAALWKGVTDEQLNGNNKLKWAYVTDDTNKGSAYTKKFDNQQYGIYNDMITNNKQMTENQKNYYNKITQRWSLDDYNDPYVQQQAQLKKDQQSALDAQDVALNKGLASIEDQNFQDMQTQRQEMSNRGIYDSGIAADTFAQTRMSANNDYMQAYTEAAQTKSDIKSQYGTAISDSKLAQQKYKDEQQAAQAEQDAANATALAKVQEQQTAQDKYLTTATGYVYLNGQMMTDSKGKPIPSVELQKLGETARHNKANESAAMQKINNDLALASQRLQYNWATLDLKSQQAQADLANAQAKLELAAKNADTAQVRAQASILNNQLKNVQKQIDGYKKADKKVPASLKATLKDIMTKMSTLASMGK